MLIRFAAIIPKDRPDLRAMQLRHEIEMFLGQGIADGGETEGGGGMGSEDIWLSVDGFKFHISIDWPKPNQG